MNPSSWTDRVEPSTGSGSSRPPVLSSEPLRPERRSNFVPSPRPPPTTPRTLVQVSSLRTPPHTKRADPNRPAPLRPTRLLQVTRHVRSRYLRRHTQENGEVPVSDGGTRSGDRLREGDGVREESVLRTPYSRETPPAETGTYVSGRGCNKNRGVKEGALSFNKPQKDRVMSYPGQVCLRNR